MKFTTKLGIGVAAATASIALIAAPAYATSFDRSDVIMGNYTYGFPSAEGASILPESIDVTNYTDALDEQYVDISTDAWTNREYIECDNPDINDAADGSGDKIITCDEQTYNGLVINQSLRLFASGQLARFVVDLKNPTSAAITYDYEYGIDVGEEDAVWESSSASGLNIVNLPTDTWAMSSGYDYDDGGLPVSYAWAGPDGQNRPTGWQNPGSNDTAEFWTDSGFEIPAGKAQSLAFFTYTQDTVNVDDAARIAQWDATTPLFGGPGGDIQIASAVAADPNYTVLMVGLDGKCVVNWDALCTEPLPDTGADSNMGVWAAVSGLVTGLGIAGFMISRRRKARA